MHCSLFTAENNIIEWLVQQAEMANNVPYVKPKSNMSVEKLNN